ncbi:MAG: carboxypeptidase regulatory-like domain-containing protein [Bryobacterales bacterium]|nr:carboxypeptidase regulatory-like domain-containing protein [Bryobacterales bacterium]
MLRALSILLALLVISCGPVFSAAADETALRVEVKTLGGSPVERASVIVRFVEGRSIIKFGRKIRTTWETRTNTEGVARVPSVPQGKVLIQVIAKGYQTFGKEFELDQEEQTVQIKLNPPQPQYSVHQ